VDNIRINCNSNIKMSSVKILADKTSYRPPLCSSALVRGYRPGDPGSIPGNTSEKKILGLERGPLSLLSTTEELLDKKVAAPV
jgi:hypothetical protein